jgi:hypothetical protein
MELMMKLLISPPALFSCTLTLLGTLSCPATSRSANNLALPLQSPPPPFVKEAAMDKSKPSLAASFTEGGIKYGNKALRWSASSPMAITVSEQNLVVFECRANTTPSVWDPCEQFKLSTDKRNQRMTGVSSFQVGKGGPLGTFTQTATLLKSGKVEIELTHTVPQGSEAHLKSFLRSILLPKHMVAGKSLMINGQTVTFPKVADWGDSPKLWDHMKHVRTFKSCIFSPKTLAEGFALSLLSDSKVTVSVFRSQRGIHLYFGGEAAKTPTGSLTFLFDFMASRVEGDSGDCIRAGINFSQCDDLDVPVYNVKGNLLMNPSFESGVRYFQAAAGDLIQGAARSGQHAFKLTGILTSMAVPIQANTPHVLSFYAKASNESEKRITASVKTFGRGTPKAFFDSPTRKHFYLKDMSQWQRFSLPISCKNSVIRFSLQSPGVLIDDLQLERAATATAYAGNPFGVELLTAASPDGLNDATKPLAARLRLQGPVGSKGSVAVEVRDFFKRRLLETTIPFKIGAGGHVTTMLPLDSDLGLGVFLVKCRVKPEKSLAFTDYLRITRVKTPARPHKHKILQGVEYVNAFGWGSVKNNPDTRFAFLRDCGIGNVAWKRNPVDSQTLARLEKYGIDFQYVNISSTGKKGRNWSTDDFWQGVPDIKAHLKKQGTVDEALLQKYEEIAYQTTRAYPWTDPLEIHNELGFTQDEQYEQYAKIALAVLRGAKRGNPNVRVMPASPCNMQNSGILELEKTLAACNRLDPSARFDLVGIHTYRPFPEEPDFEGDFQKLLAMLKKQGYGKTPIVMKEGLYFYPLNVPAWQGIAPWQATTTKDLYFHLKTPTYDLGWAERVSAAMMLRQWLACYKHRDRIERSVTWAPIQLNAHTPYAWVAMSSALADMLGDADFKAEIRPARGTRAYLFEDAEGRPIAALCHWTEALDRGKEMPPELLVDFGDVTPEFVDMLGNPHEAPHIGNRYQLPISNYPFYIKAKQGQLKALKTALVNATLTNSQVPLEFSTSLKNRHTTEIHAINPLTQPFKGQLSIADAPFKACVIKPLETMTETAPLKNAISFDRIIDYALPINVKATQTSDIVTDESTFRAFAVKHVKPNTLTIDAKADDWAGIPAIPLPNRKDAWCRPENRKWLGAADFSATFRMAWNREALYLLVEVVDDTFIMDHSKPKPSHWYNNDTIQLFFDTLGDAPAKGKTKNYGFDTNDTSYELLPTGEDSAIAYRRFSVDHQYTGGVGYGLPADTVEAGVKTAFRHVGNRQTYEVMFPARYLQPMELKAGNAPGFGMMIFDRDLVKDTAKQILMTTPISAFRRPDVYPMMLFTNED